VSRQVYFFSFRNVLCFGDVEVHLDDSGGVVGVFGESDDSSAFDSNGSGKTSLLEGIYWTLYGVTIKKRLADEVIRWDSTGGACGVVRVRTHDRDFEICRYRRDPKYKNDLILRERLDGSWVDISGEEKKDIQNKVCKVLGISAKLFMQIVFFGRDQRFSSLGDAKQKQLIEEVLGVDIYEKSAQVVRGKAKSIRDDLEKIEIRIEEQDKFLRSLRERVQEGRLAKQRWEIDFESRGDRLRKTIEDLDVKLFEIDRERKRDVFGPGLGPLSHDPLLEELGDVRSRESEVGVSESRLSVMYHAQRNDWIRERGRLQGTKDSINRQLDRIKSLIMQGRCVSCGQTISEGYAQEESTAKNEELLATKNQLSDVSKNLGMWDEAMMLEQSKLRSEREELENRRVALESQIGAIEKQQSRLEHLDYQYEDALARRKDTERNLALLGDGLYPYLSNLENVEEELLSAEEVHRGTKESIDQLTLLYSKYKVLEGAFGTKGIRSYLMESFFPELNRRLSYYSDILSNGQMSAYFSALSTNSKGEETDGISLRVVTPRREVGYDSGSGGEQTRLDLPIILALQDVAALRGVSLGFCAFDEVFDRMDKSGIDGIMETLQDASTRPHTPNIFVITHKDDLALRFSRKIIVSKKKDCTSLRNG